MDQHNVGVLHPGDMGISVAATIQNSGHASIGVPQGAARKPTPAPNSMA